MNNSDISISCIIKPKSGGDTFQRLFDKSSGGSAADGYNLALNDSQLMIFIGGGRSIESVIDAIPVADVFYHVVATKKSGESVGTIYVNAVDKFSNFLNPTNVIPNVATGARIGSWNHSTAREYEGLLEELTVSNIIPSFDRVVTEFNNKMNNAAFWFKSPLLENGVDNFLVDDQGRRIVAVGQ